MIIYLIGSLRNPDIPKLANELRSHGHEVFDDWYAAGPEADDYWQKYEIGKGNAFSDALKGWAAQHVFKFDKEHLDRCDAVVLALPAGKSGHLELGYAIGRGKAGFILYDKEPERYDVMYCFATGVYSDKVKLFDALNREKIVKEQLVEINHLTRHVDIR